MRLSKIRLAGFKSFVDPTTVHLPSNLTGVVGPNGCGKSNVIDAVRWVMGELSARHLRGESMADVIFNGSSSRQQIGTASVELVFDNADGKIGGPYASYSEISLKRVVARDGSSSYFINGGRCRRKDITQLFLGTGLGSRSYAIIEQGMISRVIEARADDMRAFIEEAAGISLYKERRRETEGRIADTRENLARVQDLRDEVDKQIRHLQRQAATARRYQELRGRERTLTAELLALRMRELEGGTAVQDAATQQAELLMQQELAEQRSCEAALEKQREFHAELGAALGAVQGRYYELGAEVTRTEENIRHTTELRNRHRQDLQQTEATLTEVGARIVADQERIAQLQAELAALAPELATLQAADQAAGAALAAAEAEFVAWQERWEDFNRELGAARQGSGVEAARIEQLEGQLLRLQAQSDRLAVEHESLGRQRDGETLEGLSQREAAAAQQAQALESRLSALLASAQQLRGEQHDSERRLEELRARRDRARAELLSLEALQRAALGEKDPAAAAWLEGFGRRSGHGTPTRVADTLVVAAGWEHAVETVLGDYLEAVCVDDLDQLGDELQQLERGTLSFLETAAGGQGGGAGTLAAQVHGPAAALAILSRVRTCETLAQAMRERRQLPPGDSLVTRAGEWLGRDWLRLRRGGDPHAGVLERAQRLKQIGRDSEAAAAALQEAEAALAALRARAAAVERERDEVQAQIQAAHRGHGELRAQLGAMQARQDEAQLRRMRLEGERGEVDAELARARAGLMQAQAAYDQALLELQRLDSRQPLLVDERELLRERGAAARRAAQAAQLAVREAMIRNESRRAALESMQTAAARLVEQRAQLTQRHEALSAELADGDAPVLELRARLQAALDRRVEVEAELANARQAQEDADQELRAIEQRRSGAEQRVAAARAAMDTARMQAQESRVRRESLAEQFAQTRFELADITAGLAADANVTDWEARLEEARADIEKLGPVNLAAIEELAQQAERKSYLDRQFADVSEALSTLEDAMKRMDKETRARFEDTFNRVNAGLKEKFPRLFGGGHAYLELVGDDPLAAGVAVMARPPGKRNSTISQLSGGEKALTAVALVFSIFDLNPAPFCLLDEVDAPLDEHNVARFCDIVREMSSRVQFIFITHNKTTMELASQLLGVTMNEPGVSRLVSVDVDAAVRLAAV
ncbi:MAG TPA: chromosome segregation protein SMC [Steroidobacteraceae bacterium]|nr:chromosome segregation protein SMC [Steroidobacteraceae bacterium]